MHDLNSNYPYLLYLLKNLISDKKKKLLIIGDHLEQMFTVDKDILIKEKFITQLSLILTNKYPITFLFCIREDYLPDLFKLSNDIPEMYERKNTFRLYRLDRENGTIVFEKASSAARQELNDEIILQIVEDLCYEGDGVIYPPYLQIVGHKLYSELNKSSSLDIIDIMNTYNSLGGVTSIVNKYLESLLDSYQINEKPLVSHILRYMVTDYFTKKRVSLKELIRKFPDCDNLENILDRLINQRIIRPTLGDYELIHDFLANRIIEILDENDFRSPPVRAALLYIENNYQNSNLTTKDIAKAAGVTSIHLASLFKKQIGRTTNKILNSYRIAKSKELISTSLDPISHIYLKVGFKNLSSFSRKFRELEGISPLQYRSTLIPEND